MKHTVVTFTYKESDNLEYLDAVRRAFDFNMQVLERIDVYERGWFGSGRNKVILILQQLTDEKV